MDIKAVESNTAQAMKILSEIEDKQRTAYALLNSVRASLEEEGRKRETPLTAS